jgi:hypothetical protein
MPLTFKNLERPPADIARGIAAAEAVFARAGVSPEVAHRHGLLRRDGMIFSPPLVRLWYAAEDAAVRAACGSWREAPLNVAMEWEDGRCES